MSAEARKVEAWELEPGDLLFDTFGGTHAIVSRRRVGSWVETTRHDGWEDRFHCTDTITIIRPKTL